LIQNLIDVKEVLDSNNVPFWLEHGTLLGAVREGKIISGDNDIDLASKFESVIFNFDEISKRFYNMGYDVYLTDVKLTLKRGKEQISIFLYRKGIIPEHRHRYRVSKRNYLAHILLYGFLEGLTTQYKDNIHHFTMKKQIIYLLKRFMMCLPEKKKLWELITAVGKKIGCLYVFDIAFPEYYVDRLKEITFYGVKVNIPIESEKYLAWMYGKDWRIPNKDYDRALDFYRDMESYNLKRDLLYHLKLIVDLFNKHNINFWMYGGALLGYVRDGDLIPWDKDIDLFVWTHDYKNVLELKEEIKKLGFKISIREKCMMLCWEDKNITVAHYDMLREYAVLEKLCTRNKFGNLVYYGLLCKAVERDMTYTYLFLRWLLLKLGGCYLVQQTVPVHFYLDLKEIDFFGIKLKVPADTEKYFDWTFGSQWRKPLHKKFKYAKNYIKVISGEKPRSLKYHSDSIR